MILRVPRSTPPAPPPAAIAGDMTGVLIHAGDAPSAHTLAAAGFTPSEIARHGPGAAHEAAVIKRTLARYAAERAAMARAYEASLVRIHTPGGARGMMHILQNMLALAPELAAIASAAFALGAWAGHELRVAPVMNGCFDDDDAVAHSADVIPFPRGRGAPPSKESRTPQEGWLT